MSLAFKTPAGSDFGDFQALYGSGFNAEIEIGWNWTESLDESRVSELFLDLVKKIDHRHLGFDAPELKIGTPESLLLFCRDYLSEKNFAPAVIRFRRGEDILYSLNRN